MTVKSIFAEIVGVPPGVPTRRTTNRPKVVALTPIKLICPGGTLCALLGKFMECLADEYRPGKSSMHPKRFAAALYHRSDAGVLLDVGGVSPARSIRTKESKKTGSQLFSGPRKTLEEKMVRMRFEKFLNPVIKFIDSFVKLT